MKSHFSIEWLSQSSCDPGSQRPSGSAGPVSATDQDEVCTSSTAPESLPGFYCSSRESSAEPQERVAQIPSAVRAPGPSSSRHNELHHTIQEADNSSSMEEEETSGYESEGGRSPLPARAGSKVGGSPVTGRRPRTAFTAEQIGRLEKAFKKNAYLGTHDKAELCQKLHLSDKQIRNWFQNRRMKLKRTLQDALAQACQAKVASQLAHCPELQTYRPSPYPSYSIQEASGPYLPLSALQYSPAVGAVSTLPLDSHYPFSGLPCLVAPPAGAALLPHYQPYPHHY